jgi:hypothetical protein
MNTKPMRIIKTLTAGTMQDLNKQIDRYFRNYHPIGYGTEIISTNTAGSRSAVMNDDGMYEVRIARWSSCD